MPVALLPPVSSSAGTWNGEMPLTRARRYVRGPGNSRWHRVRSGYQWSTGRVTLNYWCGPFAQDAPGRNSLQYRDRLPAGEPACGTCVGRALGAKQDEQPADLPPLVFSPLWVKPPAICPGSRSRTLWTEIEEAHGSVGRCLACGDLVSIRTIGRGYNAWGAGPVYHAPGRGLIDPCPFHAWNRLIERVGGAGCACGWPYHAHMVVVSDAS